MPTGNNFVTIPWADGTNDNLYMDFSKLETGEPIQLSSDDNSSKKERAKIFGQYDHVRVYGRDYFDKLRSIGFKVDEVDYTKTITPELVEKYCLAKGEIIPVCYK